MSSERRSLLRLLLVAAALALFSMHGPVFASPAAAHPSSAAAADPSHPAAAHPSPHAAAAAALPAPGPAATDASGMPQDHDHGAHLLHLCLAILVALVCWATAWLLIATPAWFDARRGACRLRGSPSARPPPYGADLLTRLSVSLT
ncbi:hypothetical protein [Cumulibacter manganitolerans]|uniref:hypothetical protein n=1 Tax=Cumulibacter manganitolerans TaxID=1884992 RepID=UPI001296BE99|nr:hypothetical protein [Cumulibacter manganitolerans]